MHRIPDPQHCSYLSDVCSFQGAAVAADPATGEVVERPEGYEPPVMDTV
jgi:hypothetical protein